MTDRQNNILLRWITALLLSFPLLASASEGDLTLSVPVLDSKVVIHTRALFAGAVSSLIFRGKEYIDSRDHGRLLQSAASFDGYGECFNPTEGGAAHNSQNENVSVLKAARVEGNHLSTTAEMGFWLSPGQAYPNGCGGNKSLTHAVNTVPTSDFLLEKRLTVGLPGFPNVIEHRVTFHVPKNFSSGTFEASTGYVPKEFSRALYYDPEYGSEIDPGNQQGESKPFPIILFTPDKLNAMGVYSPQLPQKGRGYGQFTFPDVNKWNCVFRETNITPGPYSFHCLIVIGTLSEVESTLRRLDVDKAYGHHTH
jgi:hypothetical protein